MYGNVRLKKLVNEKRAASFNWHLTLETFSQLTEPHTSYYTVPRGQTTDESTFLTAKQWSDSGHFV